jgi:hypothetical protein
MDKNTKIITSGLSAVGDLVVIVANRQNQLARIIAELPSLPAAGRETLLSWTASHETECERLESFLSDVKAALNKT